MPKVDRKAGDLASDLKEGSIPICPGAQASSVSQTGRRGGVASQVTWPPGPLLNTY